MKKSILAVLAAAVCILLTGCTNPYPDDGPKIESGDYIQQALLFDNGSYATSEEIHARSWRINEDLTLEDKLENLEEFRSYGKGKIHGTSASELMAGIADTALLTQAGYTIDEITDGRLYANNNGHDILLMRTAAEDTLLATVYEDSGTKALSSLFLLKEGEIPPTISAIDFGWNPYALSGFVSALYDHRFPVDFNAMVSAILQGEDYFFCADMNNIDRLTQHGEDIFPPYAQIVANIFFTDGVGQIVYKVTDAERIEILNQFDRSVSYMIEQAVKQDDNPATAAIALYRAYTYQIMYDYDAVTDAVSMMQNTDLSAYRALTEYEGQAESFAAGFAYLCNQIGVKAISVGHNLTGHAWTLMELDGRYYYADPCWETQAGGLGLQYFGLNAQQRAQNGGFLNYHINIGHSGTLYANGLDISDTRFAPLQQFTTVDGLLRADGNLIVYGYNGNGDKIQYTVEKEVKE
jgi:hypothetical protein